MNLALLQYALYYSVKATKEDDDDKAMTGHNQEIRMYNSRRQ
jgi:hypothetical protein